MAITVGPTPIAPGEPRALFLDPDLEEAFTRHGFVQVPLLDADEVAELKAGFHRQHESSEGFVPDYLLDDPELKRATDRLLRPVLAPRLAPLFEQLEPFMTSYLMKWPDEHSALGLHRDWTYVDERRFRTAVVWVALDDADDEIDNGPLRVLPGSHRIAPRWRGTHTEDPFGPHHELILDRYVQEVPVRAGEAVIMDNRLLHCSAPNRSGRPRLAAAMAVRPAEARLLHPYQVDGSTIEIRAVDERFFLDFDPAGLKVAGPPPYPVWARAAVPKEDLAVSTVAEAAGAAPPEDDPSTSGGADDPTGRSAGGLTGVRRRLVGRALLLNRRVIGFTVPEPSVLPTEQLDWVQRLEAGWPAVRAEVDSLLAEGVRLPRMAEILGVDQGDEGRWRALVLVARGVSVARNVARMPETARLLDQVPGLQSALLSSFPPGMHLPPHRGPNKGVLRYHLGVVVPDPPGACALRVGDRTVPYEEGRSILFDDTFEHEAWNHTDGERISLFLEVRRPLPVPLRAVNGGVQRFYGIHPEATGVAERAAELDEALNGRLSSEGAQTGSPHPLGL